MSDPQISRIKRPGDQFGIPQMAAPSPRILTAEELDRELAGMDMRSAIHGQAPDVPPHPDWEYRWVSDSERCQLGSNPVSWLSKGYRPVHRTELAEWANFMGLAGADTEQIRYKTHVLYKTTKRQASRLKDEIHRSTQAHKKPLTSAEANIADIHDGVYGFEDTSKSERRQFAIKKDT